MGAQKTELEFTSAVPAEKFYKAICLENHTTLPKVIPQAYKSFEVEGDGGVGTIKHVSLGDDNIYKKMKLRIDAIEKEALSYSYSIIGGDALQGIVEKVENHYKFVSKADGGCTAKITTIFHPKGDAVIPQENIKYADEQTTAIFKAVEAHLIAN